MIVHRRFWGKPLALWVEAFVGEELRIVGVLEEIGCSGDAMLTYRVQQNFHPDRGPYESFSEALSVARGLSLTLR